MKILHEKAKQVLAKLDELEEIHPCFSYAPPTMIFRTEELKLMIFLSLDLRAGDEENFFSVHLNTSHAYVSGNFSTDYDSVHCEAQEAMTCKGAGFEAIHEHFIKHGAISGPDYTIDIDGDMLIFDDHDLNHTRFRGWTGGYDPGYTGLLQEGFDRRLIEWYGADFHQRISRRVRTLEALFQGINITAGFEVHEPEKTGRPDIDHHDVFVMTRESDLYRRIKSTAQDVESHLGIAMRPAIYVRSGRLPTIVFSDRYSAVKAEESYSGRFNAEIHVPQSPCNAHMSRNNYIDNQGPNKGKKMVYHNKYVDSQEELSEALEDVWRELKGP